MLPQLPGDDGAPTRTIYINPNFNKTKTGTLTSTTHINPNFLHPRTHSTIHLNPHFLQKKLIEQQLLMQQNQQYVATTLTTAPPLTSAAVEEPRVPEITAVCSPIPSCKLITKSRMRIVREPSCIQSNLGVLQSSTLTCQHSPMIKFGRRKLMRSTLLRPTTSVPLEVKEQRATIGSAGKYKIDRRRARSLTITNTSALTRSSRRDFVAHYALSRTSDYNTKRKNYSSTSKIAGLTTSFKLSAVPFNKNLQMLNINGVLYKSTRNKLQRKDATQCISAPVQKASTITSASTSKSSGRTLFIRGARFVLDKEGFKMIRVVDPGYSKQPAGRFSLFRRIDIGGLTYVAKSKNLFVRTGNHLVRSHVNNAKQKSIQVLSRSLVKSNIPCAIFQRVGKCAAFERGKCRKVHDRRQVSICTRFLRGDCSNPKCLLSHNISLSKMPVCKFFIQGVCVRSDCPYLHKKVSQKTEICSDFLRGFCTLAKQCDKRHEFLCPENERNGKCEKLNCLLCKKMRQVKGESKRILEGEPAPVLRISSDNAPHSYEEATPKTRYFISNAAEEICSQSLPELEVPTRADVVGKDEVERDVNPATNKPPRPKLGILPSYIPLT